VLLEVVFFNNPTKSSKLCCCGFQDINFLKRKKTNLIGQNSPMNTMKENRKDELIIEYFELFDQMQECQKIMNNFITNGLLEFSFIKSRSFDSDVLSFIHVPQEITPKITILVDEKQNLFNIQEEKKIKKKSSDSMLTSKKEQEMKDENPLYWYFSCLFKTQRFSLLPSSELLTAQSNFKQAIFKSVELASIRVKMNKIEKEFEKLN
jgi:hypothetical protein